MKRKIMQRLLATVMCASMIFQNVSYDVYASEVSVSSVQSEETVTESDTDNSGDAMAVDADNSVETSASDEEITSSTETSYEAEDKTATSNASNDEAVTEAEATETKATETETTETETTETETETETTEIETIELDKKASDGELTGVTVENMSFSFSGFEAKLSDDTTVTIANPDDYRWVSFYLVQYKDDEELYERWCSFNGDNGVYKNSSTSFVLSKDTTHVALRVEASDKFGEVLEFTSDKIARTNKAEDVKFTISDVSTSISRLDATINYTGDMKFSDDISNAYFDVTLYYGTSDDQNEWSRLASGFSASRYKNENHSIYFSGLEGGKTYHGRIVVSLNAGYYSENTSYGFYQEIYLDDFTTKPDGTIDFQTAFPDKNFRTAVVNRLGDSSLSAEDETIAKSKLEKLTELNCYNSNSENVITSIKGIDLLTNVTYIDLQNNEIEDASEGIDWSKLTKLKSLYLNGNNLTKVPDFSKNENLTYLNLKENLLTDEVIAGIKTPSGCTVYTDDQRVGGFRLIAEDNYYIYNGASHLFVKPTGCKSDSSISYKFYVDDSTEELSMTKYYSDYYYNRNTGLLEGPHTIKVVMFKNGVESDSATAAFNVVKQGVFAEKEKYYVASSAANDNSNYITLNLYTDDLKANIDKVELVDKNGNVYADCTGAAQYTTNSDPRYTKFYYYANNILQHCNVRMEILKNSIPAGDYNIVITYKDGTSDKLENLVNVTSDMVITDIYGGYDNDMTGDYIFLSLQGSGINPEKLDYSFTYNNVEYSATYVSYKPTSSGVLVKLKKDASMPNKNNMSVTVNITPKNGNTAYITQATNKIYLNTGIFWLAYNQATNQFETGISAILGRDGTVEAELWSGIPFYDNNVKLATAKSVLNDDGIAYFTFLNDDGSEWFPTESKSYYVYCTYKGDTSYDSTWVSVSNYSTSINYWSGYSKYLAGTGNTTFHYYEGATYSKTDTYESVITGDNLSSELKTTVKTSDYSDSTTGTKVVLVEQKYDLSKLAVGKYTITLKKNEEVLSTKSLTIMPNKFILDYF
jgi:Leucine-rich repeat (LRR) protein